jgi:Cd2+/Zn2+-exporting ATPase
VTGEDERVREDRGVVTAVNQNGLQMKNIEIRAGSERLLAEAGAMLPMQYAAQEKTCADTGTSVDTGTGMDTSVDTGTGTACHVAIGGRYAGTILLADELRPDSRSAVSALRAAGVKQLYMLTGDNAPAADAVSKEIGLDGYYAGLLPHQKVERLEELSAARSENGTLAFVGDGINDAPVLARADIGIAMGGIGSDAAIEAADAVIMADEPSRLATAIRVAKKTHAIVLQNIVFALGVKGILLVLGALGLANMWMAVFGDVGVAAICVLNSLRALRN